MRWRWRWSGRRGCIDDGVAWGFGVFAGRFFGGVRSSRAREALALASSAPLRTSAARAAHREALALGSLAPLRSSAARAALRGASPLPHLLQRAVPVRPWLFALAHGWRQVRRQQCQPKNLVEPPRLATMAYQAMARCNKCGSGLAPRSAARAALDLKGAEDIKASGARSHYHPTAQAMRPANATAPTSPKKINKLL